MLRARCDPWPCAELRNAARPGRAAHGTACWATSWVFFFTFNLGILPWLYLGFGNGRTKKKKREKERKRERRRRRKKEEEENEKEKREEKGEEEGGGGRRRRRRRERERESGTGLENWLDVEKKGGNKKTNKQIETHGLELGFMVLVMGE